MMVVYVTYPSHEEAKAVSSTLLEEKLCACVNIFAAHESLYRWEGQVRSETEVAAIYKIPSVTYDALKNRLVELHSYDVPCIVGFDISQGHEPFIQWVEKQIFE